ncbi:hypothetical protein SODALDRAFT_347154 [Sodiomyces alkalinus F11]|uniref:Uncharacterized protein n=1 Tax=Sodiomyces alkalinus (strain CBS 110278 / VKM F-3762 / F11) TaxID=1314773 RepID=A0A3N2Q5U1_SODAK|nr:hypothetical protein SODALDRAFT_347154 [Sodiomyces alkalinus F11]ROT42067.1 hypothetical protein SODALDRAFT_347154 [Sodiomyces alkalinus F11]
METSRRLSSGQNIDVARPQPQAPHRAFINLAERMLHPDPNPNTSTSTSTSTSISANPRTRVKIAMPAGRPPPRPSQGQASSSLQSQGDARSSLAAQSKPQRFSMARRGLGPTCTHTTMTRIYSIDLRCDSCHQVGAFGWLYRCTQDREELICQMLAVGSKATFDETGDVLATQVKPRLRGPEARADKLSFFNEITSEQLQTYSAEQVAAILRQREHVQNVIKDELARHREDRAEKTRLFGELRQKTGEHVLPEVARIDRWDELQKMKPWVPRPEDECQFKVCPACRETGAERASISLEGVLNGDIPATAATGYGFHVFDRRPVYDAAFVAKLGEHASRRQAPVVTTDSEAFAMPSERDDSTTTSMSSNASSTDDQLPDTSGRVSWNKRGWNSQGGVSTVYQAAAQAAAACVNKGHLPRSPGSPDLSHLTDVETFLEKTTEMEKRESEEGKFGDKPLEVDKGVALSEESVELHIPDVLTQV